MEERWDVGKWYSKRGRGCSWIEVLVLRIHNGECLLVGRLLHQQQQ